MIRNPIPWPNGARCACAITFDMDADSLIHISRPKDGHDRLYPISMGRYGPTVAVPRILDTYRAQPPSKFGEVAVAKFQDFGREDIRDADGELIPKQDLYLVTLANGYSFAARGSGTEPKMKFYLFANEKVGHAAELPVVKAKVRTTLEALIKLIEADAKARAES